MRQKLPERPHLDHLKKQAKELVELHRSGNAGALSRIRESLPAFAGATDEAVASAPFALHDAQSVIAREYGFPSFVELSDSRRRATTKRVGRGARAARRAGPPCPTPSSSRSPMPRVRCRRHRRT
ncbi:MAG TPA: hypothetical protein VH142_18035 [Polyangiaceae bacterium]|jgi:hypothetical protein|nr:hypothetical protein [Polyangiaceae bacterium]